MKKVLIFICLLFPFFGESMTKKEQLFNFIIKQHVQEQQKNQLIPYGTGGGIPDQITLFTFDFVSHKKVDVEEARRMLVHGVEILLAKINNNKEIQPFLKNIPFNSKNINYNISYYDKKNHYLAPPNVALVFIEQGKIYYCYHNIGELGFDSSLNKSEPYEEALRIVQGEESPKKESF